jgi:hypothetical protein
MGFTRSVGRQLYVVSGKMLLVLFQIKITKIANHLNPIQ